MKATCLKKYFKEAVGLCEKISGKNLSLPVLSNILIDTGDNELKLSATNLELGIEIKIPAKIGKKGKIAVPANIISGFLSTFSGEESVTLEAQNNNNLLVSTDSSSTIIKGQPTDDFPILPQNKLSNSFLVPVGEFVLGLKSVWYACSTSNVKPEISSVMVVVKEKNMTFAATDSFRLAEKKIKNKTGEYGPILIPYRTVAEIIRIFEGREGDVKISSDKNQLFMETDGVVFISRLMDGVFPDYQQIIPSKFSSDVVISKELFTNTLKTASVFSGKLCEVGLSFDKNGDVMIIKTSNQDTGEHVSKVQAKVTGEELSMSFNHKYIIDCLNHIVSPEIILRFSGNDRPLLISGTDDMTFQYLAMPLNGV